MEGWKLSHQQQTANTMAEDTFTMADVEAINLETPEPAPAEEAKAADTERGEAGESGTEGLQIICRSL